MQNGGCTAHSSRHGIHVEGVSWPMSSRSVVLIIQDVRRWEYGSRGWVLLGLSLLSKMQVQDLGESYNVSRTSCLKSKFYSESKRGRQEIGKCPRLCPIGLRVSGWTRRTVNPMQKSRGVLPQWFLKWGSLFNISRPQELAACGMRMQEARLSEGKA